MEKDDAFYELLKTLHVARDTVFISLSSADKPIAVKFIRAVNDLKIKYWAMYNERGEARNKGGDVYTDPIAKAMAKCCVFVLLLSRSSISSSQVKVEIAQLKKERAGGDNIHVFPVIVDDIGLDDIPFDIAEFSGISSQTIVKKIDRSLNGEELEANIKNICVELGEQYKNACYKNIERRVIEEKNSQKFTDLMRRCVSYKCATMPVSDDLKDSTEIAVDDLKEIHILSNELREYDCNTYSCMIIASNLLGNEIIKKDRVSYNPKRNGVKYFYYYPVDREIECEKVFDKIKRFIRKDDASRREVVSMIRREFCFRNKLIAFFKDFNDMTINKFIEQYHITGNDDSQALYNLFGEETKQVYFPLFGEDEDKFQVPEDVFAWMNGKSDKISYDTMIKVTYEFIDFLGDFLAILKKADGVNRVSLTLLNKRYNYLVNLKELEEWQIGNIQISPAKAKNLVNYLLDHTDDNSKKSERRFPRLAGWMEFFTDANGKHTNIDEELYNAACENLIGVPIVEDERLKLCYSFIIYWSESEVSGAWYSVGQNVTLDYKRDFSMTYLINRDSNEYKDLIDAFAYMISINKSAQDKLRGKSFLYEEAKNRYSIKGTL